MARRVLTGEKLEKELERLSLMREFERQYEDCAFICGIDEAGRGPLAGPVAAGAAILPKDCQILYLNDSKKLSESRREELFLEIKIIRSMVSRSIKDTELRRISRRSRSLVRHRSTDGRLLPNSYKLAGSRIRCKERIKMFMRLQEMSCMTALS